ncbi:O-antigen ligase family protein [Sphingobacterium litopenaei]|uniref:O-antigen ligase family protein n=1 Tax=Sphingobacterium litopenaei TaxID=2763500 RepID=A0ABR7YEM8_9SPHI|nr:O-antigen ligase family protein [Sphingobacterium litopenaei]MBD1429765.1 O-antigen ligase family protein [Sphingobacterium litopenaei]
MDKYLVRIISFFIYIGFYIGIVLMLSLKLEDLTRFYSIPFRIIITLCIILYLVVYRNKIKESQNFDFSIFLYFFWFIYFIKIYLDLLGNVVYESKDSFDFGLYTIIYCIFPYIFFKRIDFQKYGNEIINAFILAGFILGITSIYLYSDLIFSGNIGRLTEAKYQGYEAKTINPLILAYTSTLTIGLVLYKLSSTSKGYNFPTKLYYIAILLISFILTLIGSSRGAFLALIITLIILLVNGNRTFRIKFIQIILFSTPLFIWLFFKVGSGIFDRLENLNNISNDNSASTRLTLWDNSLNEFMDSPLLGGRLEIGGIYPHNIFIEIMMATGLIGFLSFLIFLIYIFSKSFALLRYDNKYTWVIIFFVQSLIHYNFTESIYLSNALFISMGIIAGIKIKGE